MINAINVNAPQIIIQNTEQVQSQAAEQATEASTTSDQGDTVSISKRGAAMAKTFQAGSAYVSSEDQGFTDATAAAISSAAASIGVDASTQTENENAQMAAAVSGGSGAAASSSSSSSSTSDLSGYTAQELKEMLNNGEITQAEYDAEIESRNSSSVSNSTESEETNAGQNQTVQPADGQGPNAEAENEQLSLENFTVSAYQG